MSKLYMVPTPIGNLKDISLRVLEVLNEVDRIACEDTRVTAKLLNRYEIRKPLVSYREHNEMEASVFILDKIESGENIALVTDAGMPGISDPGEVIVRKAIERGIEKKRDELMLLKDREETLIFYEAPHRILDTLSAVKEVFGDRNISLSRELTKLYEQHLRGTVSEVLDAFKEKAPKGEFVLVVSGKSKEEIRQEIEEAFVDMSIKEQLLAEMEEGLSKKEAVQKVAKLRGIPKKEVYRESLEL